MKNRKKLIITIAIAAVVISFFRTLSHPGLLLHGSHIKEVLVSRVIDGDTIELSDGRIVRYIGIDTPETKHPYKAVEHLGEEAYLYNKELVEGRWVSLEFDVEKRDRYNRLLAYVYAGDTFVNAKLVEDGFAQIYTVPPNVKYQELFLKLQREARENKKGLWDSTLDNNMGK